MKLRKLPYDLTVCKVVKLSDFDQTADFFFIGKTDEELSVVCLTKDVPERKVPVKSNRNGEETGRMRAAFERFKAERDGVPDAPQTVTPK